MRDLSLSQPVAAPRGNGQPAACRGDGPAFGTAAVRGDDAAVCRRRNLRQDRRERARAGCLHHPAHEPAGGKLYGAVTADRRSAPGERRPHHRGASVLRLRAAGPEGPTARGDQRQAGGETDHPRRSRPRVGNGFSFPPGPGILRYPGGPSVRGAGFVSHYRTKQLYQPVVVAPDVGSAKMARGFAKRLDASLAIIDKRRPSANIAEVLNVVGEVENRDCLIPDDMIDTAGTISEAAAALKRLGAKRIFAFATHALLSGPAVERLRASPIEEDGHEYD